MSDQIVHISIGANLQTLSFRTPLERPGGSHVTVTPRRPVSFVHHCRTPLILSEGVIEGE